MKTKLIKVEDDYRLINSNNSIIGTTDLGYQQAFSDVCQKLSLKNCQAIERGYDLNELAKSEAIKISETEVRDEKLERIYKRGFQKALEILGDKKFSEEQLREAFFHVQNEPTFDVFKQSLQQTEWDVEIEMENVMHDYNGNISLGAKFKLDADGCLILKLKSE